MPRTGQGTETLLRQLEPLAGTVRLSLLDAFELTCEGERIELPLPAQRLLAFLALSNRPARRAYVACTLWTDASEEHAFGSLRSALWRLRREGRPLIEAANGRLRLAPGVIVDVHEAAACARLMLDAAGDVPDAAGHRLALDRDLLPDWYDDWVVIERERFRQLRVHALERLSERLTAAGRFAEAIEAGLAAVKSEPLRESAHRVLIRAHLAEGNPCDALRQYDMCRDLLRERLGIAPSAAMDALLATVTMR